MTVIVFPGSPVDGQLFPEIPVPGVKQYVWNAASSTWDIVPQGGGTSVTIDPNVGLTLTGQNLSTEYNTLVNDTEQSVPVGGAPAEAASVWKTRNLVEVLDAILFPLLYPTYTIPTISLSYSQSGIKEIGSELDQALSVTGIKNDAGAFGTLTLRKNGSTISSVSGPSGSPHANVPNQFGYTNPNNPNFSYSHSYTNNITVTAGITSWDGTGAFSSGLAKKTNKGSTDPRSPALLSPNAPQSAGSLISSSASINGIYPYFWGKSSGAPSAASIASDITAGITTKVLASASGSIEATFDATAEYVWFAHPASDPEKTKWYNTPLNQGLIGPGNFILYPEIQAVDSPEGYWTGVDYYVYISGYATNTSGSIQLLNS
jgi:hypothetical protein